MFGSSRKTVKSSENKQKVSHKKANTHCLFVKQGQCLCRPCGSFGADGSRSVWPSGRTEGQRARTQSDGGWWRRSRSGVRMTEERKKKRAGDEKREGQRSSVWKEEEACVTNNPWSASSSPNFSKRQFVFSSQSCRLLEQSRVLCLNLFIFFGQTHKHFYSTRWTRL